MRGVLALIATSLLGVDMSAQSFKSLPATADPGSLVSIGIEMPQVLQTGISGTIEASFVPSEPGPFPAVSFSNNRSSAPFSVAAGQRSATFPDSPGREAATIRVPTVSGRINLNILIGSTNTASGAIDVPYISPVLTSARLELAAGNRIDVVVEGYSTPRDLVSAQYYFEGKRGVSLDGTSFETELGTLSSAWFKSEDSFRFWGAFRIRQRFSVVGSRDDIAEVRVLVSNSAGVSTFAVVKVAE